MMRRVVILLCVILLATEACRKTEPASRTIFDETVQTVSKPQEPFDNMGDEVQVCCRWAFAENALGCKFQKADAAKWKDFLSDKTAGLYGRMAFAKLERVFVFNH